MNYNISIIVFICVFITLLLIVKKFVLNKILAKGSDIDKVNKFLSEGKNDMALLKLKDILSKDRAGIKRAKIHAMIGDCYANMEEYSFAIVEYRPSDTAVFPAQIEDTRDAIKFMLDNADKYNADTNNLFVWGDSSGGHTSLFTAIPLSDNDNTIPNINAIISYYPPTDLLEMRNDPLGSTTGDAESPEGILIGRKNVYDFPDEAKRISPYYEISKAANLPPIFLAHGTADTVVPFNQSKILADKLKEENRVYEFYVIKDADHGDWQFWTKDMFDLVENFINKYKK